ncbi:MAG: DNA repair protein RadA [Anaerolineae bacterium]|nr:DNA repair protein RadA [Anaerolineae bacterium]
MAKAKTRFVCQECGRSAPRMMGRCPSCGQFGTMVEEYEEEEEVLTGPHRASNANSHPRQLSEISGDAEARMHLPIEEFARVLGGGIVPGSVVLVGGDPGIGKSTLTLQMAIEMAQQQTVLYVSGEESERQIKMRALRLLRHADGSARDIPQRLYLLTETNLEAILQHVHTLKPNLLIVDSIQTIYIPELKSAAGSVTQVRESSARLREEAKTSDLAIFVIGHVTKEGAIAGPRVLEHIVDTVLYLEGDRYQSFRLLRSVKNRFGATSEVGVFEMVDRGMREVDNPSEAFLAERMVNAPGSAIAVTMEGTRPILVEIQGLTSTTNFGNPRRTPNGVDFNRLLLIVAVLTRRLGLKMGDQDVFVNVVGGMHIDEPAADLSVAAAIASSLYDRPVFADTALIGEVGLSGELRWVGQMSLRLREAAKLGFKRAIIPRRVGQGEPLPEGIEVVQARSLREALNLAMLPKEARKESDQTV